MCEDRIRILAMVQYDRLDALGGRRTANEARAMGLLLTRQESLWQLMGGPSQDWGCDGQLAIFAFVLWPRVDAWLGC